MKFNCDRLWDYFAEKRRDALRKQLSWQKKFAFFPTKIRHGQCVWLEFYYRRGEYHDYWEGFWTWQYMTNEEFEERKTRNEI